MNKASCTFTVTEGMTDQEKIELLATKVMGWEIDGFDTYSGGAFRKINEGFKLWNPLAKIADAWMIVEKMRDMWTSATEGQEHNDNFDSPFDDTGFFESLHRSVDRRWPWAFLYVTPQAICEAALKVIKE